MSGLAAPLLASASALAVLAAALSAFRSRRPVPVAAPRDGLAPRWWERVRGWNAFAARVGRSGLGVGPELVIAGAVLSGVAVALALLVVLRNPVVACLGVIVPVVVIRAVLAAADRRYLRRVGDAMPGVAQMLAGAVAAGLSLRQALVRAARDTPDPLGAELRTAAGEMELGARVDDALAGLAARMPDPDLGLLVTAILVQRRTGGDLARALRDMSARLEERGRLTRELRGATAQARATAWMVAGLPAMGAVLAEAAAPGLIGRTASTPLGAGVLLASVLMQALGIVVIRRIAAIQP